MSFVKINLKNVKEPEVASEGEYDLRIVKVQDKETKKGEPMTLLTIVIENAGPNIQPFNHNLMYPNGGEWDTMRLLEIKRLVTLFDVHFDGDGFDPQELKGKTAKALVIQEEGDDDVVRNKMRLPRIKE